MKNKLEISRLEINILIMNEFGESIYSIVKIAKKHRE